MKTLAACSVYLWNNEGLSKFDYIRGIPILETCQFKPHRVCLHVLREVRGEDHRDANLPKEDWALGGGLGSTQQTGESSGFREGGMGGGCRSERPLGCLRL